MTDKDIELLNMNSRQRIKVLKMYNLYIKGNKYSKSFFQRLYKFKVESSSNDEFGVFL